MKKRIHRLVAWAISLLLILMQLAPALAMAAEEQYADMPTVTIYYQLSAE